MSVYIRLSICALFSAMLTLRVSLLLCCLVVLTNAASWQGNIKLMAQQLGDKVGYYDCQELCSEEQGRGQIAQSPCLTYCMDEM